MKAWTMNGYDGIETLRREEVPDPDCGPKEVLLKVRFAALNPADAFLAQGLYPAKPPLPHILGRDGVGEVLQVGPEVNGIHVGTLLGIMRGATGVEQWGTLAEKVVVPAAHLVPVPEGWSVEEMAGAPLVFLTAWQALTQWSEPPAPPRGHSVVLVTGASGGVGTATVLLARSMEVTVVAMSRSAEKRAKLKALGADGVLDPVDPKWPQTLAALLESRKVDLVVDTVGGSLFNKVIAVLGRHGRVSVVGRSGGVVPEFNTATLFFRRIRIGGVAVGDYGAQDAQAVWKQIVERLDRLGQRPLVDRVYSFDDVQAAFAYLAQGPMGKVLIRITD